MRLEYRFSQAANQSKPTFPDYDVALPAQAIVDAGYRDVALDEGLVEPCEA